MLSWAQDSKGRMMNKYYVFAIGYLLAGVFLGVHTGSEVVAMSFLVMGQMYMVADFVVKDLKKC